MTKRIENIIDNVGIGAGILGTTIAIIGIVMALL